MTLMLVGWAVSYGVAGLFGYAIAVAVAVAFHLRVVFGEEPWLARRYGDEWARYAGAVARWL